MTIKTTTFSLLVLISQIFGHEIYHQSPSLNDVPSTMTQRRLKRFTSSAMQNSKFPKLKQGLIMYGNPQRVRLVNGTLFSGVVQTFVVDEWREVCSHKWNIKDANVLCKQLGFQRGAFALNSTFLVSNATFSFGRDPISRLSCDGHESTIMACPYKIFKCPSPTPATVTCIRNRYSYCNDGEEPIGDHCYRFVKEKMTAYYAQNTCRALGSELVYIDYDNEFNFLTPRLLKMNNLTEWYISGYKLFDLIVNAARASKKTIKRFSVINQTYVHEVRKPKENCFYLEYQITQTNRKQLVPVIKDDSSLDNPCSLPRPFICKHVHYSIGCIEQNGETYLGEANVTRSGLPCLPWDAPNLPINANTKIVNKILRGHNYCRNPDADNAPWCYYSPSKYDYCNIPQCNADNQDESENGLIAISCSKEQYRCASGMCIQNDWFCDGERDCLDGDDESDCPDQLLEFEKMPNRTIAENDLHVIKPVTLTMCAKHCINKENNACKSFVYNSDRQRCFISEKNRTSGVILNVDNAYDYYERKIRSGTLCETGFKCANGKCISSKERCNTINDCGDGSDELHCNCNASNNFTCQNGQCIPFTNVCDGKQDCTDGSDEITENCRREIEVRLSGGSSSMSGRVEIKYRGVWGTICDDTWDDADAQVVCRSLGFFGPSVVSITGLIHPTTAPILLDNIHCFGLEPSLAQCERGEWYKHDCTHSEDAVVTCTHGENFRAIQIPGDAILPQDCGTRSISDDFNNTKTENGKIAGGRDIIRGAYPWHVSLLKGSITFSYHCGASIISEYFVITAAHCVSGWFSTSSYRIRVGDSNSNVNEQDEEDFEVQNIFNHPKFNSGQALNNDIALIKIKPKDLGRGFKFGNYVRPICLPSLTTMYTPGTSCYITGFGSTYSKGTSRMLVASVPILPRSKCSGASAHGPRRLTAGMFCAGYMEGGIDTCKGDSGGPLACKMNNDRFTLFGVTSWGAGCAKPNKPGVYVTVGNYLPWIYKHVNESTPRNENSQK